MQLPVVMTAQFCEASIMHNIIMYYTHNNIVYLLLS